MQFLCFFAEVNAQRSSSAQANIDGELCVQLFEYTRVYRDSSERAHEAVPAAPGVLKNFQEFVSGKPKTYPSTLHVKVTHTLRPDRREVTQRPTSIFEREVRHVTEQRFSRGTAHSRHIHRLASKLTTR